MRNPELGRELLLRLLKARRTAIAAALSPAGRISRMPPWHLRRSLGMTAHAFVKAKKSIAS
jgi:hypothetical protein